MGYSNMDNIHIVVSLLKQNNIHDLVISPGGTNIPIIKATQDDPFFNCFSVIDERSAAYVAIGISIQRKNPVALICTSAQATRNYIPGLTEAFYKRIPLVAITMEKHPRFKYQEYMQAPDQTSLPNDSVKRSFELPYISDINDYYHSVRVANEAMLELSKNGYGPVQICIPWLDFPLEFERKDIKAISRFQARDLQYEDLKDKKIMIVIGEHIPFTEEERRVINDFCEKTNSVVYSNHLSNFSNRYTVKANLFLLTSTLAEIDQIKPDILISIGGQTGDYPFYLMFSKPSLEHIDHWRLSEDGEVVDTYDKLTRVYQGSIVDFFGSFFPSSCEHGFYETWAKAVNRKTTDIEVPFSNVSIAQYMHSRIPNNSIIQFSILNSLRVWNLFHLDPSIECYSNVGAFGIDGGMSTLIGQSLATDKLAFMIIGDLAFLYDMNCLSLRDLRNNVRILLINNNGGIEFKLYEGSSDYLDRYIAAANYHGSAKGWAESCGFEYFSAKNMDEFKKNLVSFVSTSEKPILFEIFVTDDDESKAYLSVVNSNKTKTAKDSVKGMVKGLLGRK